MTRLALLVLGFLALLLFPLAALATDSIAAAPDPAAQAWVVLGSYVLPGTVAAGGTGLFSVAGWYVFKAIVRSVATDIVSAAGTAFHDALVKAVKECGPEIRAALVELLRESPPFRVQVVPADPAATPVAVGPRLVAPPA